MADFVELSLITDSLYSEQVEAILFASGASSITIESAGDEVRFDIAMPQHEKWKNQRIRALFDDDRLEPELLQYVKLQMKDVPGVHALTTSILKDQNWETAWHERFHPLQIGRRLLISPTWCTPDCSNKIVIWINPGLAFGTGGHETTRLCLEYLDGMNLEGKSVIDYGCGSGILGIAASKLGARQVIGVDIDDRAVDAANRNSRINSVSDSFQALSVEHFWCRGHAADADLVIANILAGTLVGLSNRISSLVSGTGVLMLCGILNKQKEAVISAYERSFRFSSRSAGDWLLLSGERSDG